MSDAAARKRIREDFDSTFVVEASAGTGKTTELVTRLVRLVCSGRASLARVLGTTFTDKAAGELKLRLRHELERARERGGAEAKGAARAIGELERARIGTIHSVCTDILREHPVRAGLDPRFEVLPDDRARAVFADVFRRWFEREAAAPREGARRLLDAGSGDPRRRLWDAAWEICQNRDSLHPYPRTTFDREGALREARGALERLASHAGSLDGGDNLSKAMSLAAGFVEDLTRREAAVGADWDALEGEIDRVVERIPWKGGRLRGGVREEAARARDQARATLDAVLLACRADVAALLSEELREVVAAYEARLRKRGAVDFLDLLVRTRELLAGSPEARTEIASGLDRIFVDEFQDTDPVQIDVVLLLSGDGAAASPWDARPAPGKLFLVGDPKQSIYRFRRADLAAYERAKQHLVERGAEVLTLTRSHRALASIQSVVNAAFESPLSSGHRLDPTSQAPWAPLEAGRNLSPPSPQPAVVALPVPRPYQGDSIRKTAIRASLPLAVGAWIEWLIDRSGFRVEEAGEWVPVEPRHVCLLFKRFEGWGEDVTRPYVEALERHRIPHVLLGGRSFHSREEVLAFRSALSAVEHAGDELAIYAALRGPLFGLSDDALLAYREAVRAGLGREHLGGTLHLLRAVEPAWLEGDQADDAKAVAEAIALLRDLHLHRNRRSFATTAELLLEGTRAHAGVALPPGGETALANVLRVVELARQADARGLSFRAFVDELEAGETSEGPLVEEGAQGVRLMTVHKAKGLEFPVVCLVDPTSVLSWKPRGRWVDPATGHLFLPIAGCSPRELLVAGEEAARRERDEALRVVYVAATRARDLLVVPIVGDAERPATLDGWLDVLAPCLFPAPGQRRSAQPAPGCPAFGADSVLDRPPGPVGEEASIAPGLHVPERGTHEVVVWDPALLDAAPDEGPSLRYRWLLEPADGVTPDEPFAERRERELASARTPSFVTAALSVQPTARVARAAEDVEIADAGPAPSRPRGPRFGALVHAILAEAPLGTDEARLRAIAKTLAAVLGATTDEADHAAAAARSALTHPILDRARRSSDVRREEPVVLRLPNGEYREGVVDLAFTEEEGWIVVDYKTDHELAEHLARYRLQVASYADAVEQATGRPARAYLLRV